MPWEHGPTRLRADGTAEPSVLHSGDWRACAKLPLPRTAESRK